MSEYFCGWYFKCQSENQTLAVIPAFHESGDKKYCSIQVITGEGAFFVPFSCEELQKNRKGLPAGIQHSIFSERGIRLRLHTDSLDITGTVHFGTLSTIRYNIMGPFCLAPYMECRHSIFSMRHSVNGRFCVNGKDYTFRNGTGYIEGDRGHSFPQRYAWTQSFFQGGSLMLSVADIPFGVFRFTGIICVIQWKGKEYRLATYLGAKIIKTSDKEVVVRQRGLVFTAKLLEKKEKPLYAPVRGDMTRLIRESAACHAFYSLKENSRTLFAFDTYKASFEYEYDT